VIALKLADMTLLFSIGLFIIPFGSIFNALAALAVSLAFCFSKSLFSLNSSLFILKCSSSSGVVGSTTLS